MYHQASVARAKIYIKSGKELNGETMRKLIALFLILLFAITLFGCATIPELPSGHYIKDEPPEEVKSATANNIEMDTEIDENDFEEENYASIENIKANIHLVGQYDIVRMIRHPLESDIFIVQTRGHWHDILYLVVFSGNAIQTMTQISDTVWTPILDHISLYGIDGISPADSIFANFIFFDGIDEYFFGFFHSTNRGNGGFRLFDFRTNTFIADIGGVFGGEGEADYRLAQIFNGSELFFNFENNMLNVEVLDIDGDGFSDLKFYGVQRIVDENGNIVHYDDCAFVFIYNPVSGKFELSEEYSVFPKYWGYSWNAFLLTIIN